MSNGEVDDTRASNKRARTKTGCLPCRKKRKKCDETKPSCRRCVKSSDECQWDTGVHFKPENALTISAPSKRRRTRTGSEKVGNGAEIASGTQDGEESENTSPGSETTFLTPIKSNGSMKDGPPTVSMPGDVAQISSTRSEARSAVKGPRINIPASRVSNENDLLATVPEFHPSKQPQNFQSSPTAVVGTLPSISNMMLLSPPGLIPHPGIDLSPDQMTDDGIFVPGSTYQELHRTLRSRILHTANSVPNSRRGSAHDLDLTAVNETIRPVGDETLLSGTITPPELSMSQELVLWENWISEVGPWLDKFNHEKHFQHTLPAMAKNISHLKYSMFALSARQLERKDGSMPASMSLSLYQCSINLLMPQLHNRDSSVLASCVVLCVLEMFSCAPKAWRRHLDGCASLIQSMDIRIDCGGLDQALFRCFARMDLCGGLISSGTTLIPAGRWTSNATVEEDARIFSSSPIFEDWANYICYLLARALELFASTHAVVPQTWLLLFHEIEAWHFNRPMQMRAVLSLDRLSDDDTKPFQTIIYSNDAAISGNQLYHTAALLMLQQKPRSISVKSRSMLWHARQICAISLSNHSHPAWTNCIQPIWIAGQMMSHPREHKAILDLYGRIENETGWGASWRAEDLKEHWGDLN